MKTAGYSETALINKLDIKDNFKIKLIYQPDYYFELLGPLPENVLVVKDKKIQKDFIHYFTKNASQLKKDIPLLKNEIVPNGAVWVSWPKKASGVKTDLDENSIRTIALQNDLVDIKVCAVDPIWSALKLVIRLKDRK